MGVSQTDGRTEGWLYLVRLNRFGSQYTRKMFFVLRDNCLRSFKSIPSPTTNNARTAVLDSSVRVVDIGRESIQKKVFFTFSLYNTSKKNDQLKLGASSPEEAARWIQSFKNAASKGWPASPHNEISLPRRNWQSFRICGSKGMDLAIEQTCVSFVRNYPMTSDVIAPSPWKIFGCRNGLRLFKEAKDRDSSGRHWDNHPAIMSVCLIDGTSEAIFQTLMTLGPSRSEWDYCFYRGSVVEHFDGHTDVIHQQLYSNWMPWGMKRRDLLLQRYWRREDDGTYVILYHSVFHKKCPPKKGYVRACLKSGGYVVTPVNQGKQSFVKHMLAVDWKYWKFSLSKSGARSITISMLERVAALREMFRAKAGNLPSFGFFSRKFIREVRTPQSETEDVKTEIQSENEDGDTVVERKDTSLSMQANLMGLNDASDEFFDVPEPTDYELEHDWSPRPSPDFQSLDICAPKLSTSLVKKWHDRQVQKKGYVELPDMPTAASEDVKWHYGSTLPKNPSCTMPSSWNAADPSSFLVRGENYLQDQRKIKADHTLMQLVGADWLRSKQREDHLACRPGGIVQKYASKGGAEFFFVVNIQVPGATPYNLALYYMTETPLKENPLLEGFINGDSAYRNSRFKLIPYISQGSWIVKQSVGKKACLVGQALEVNYFQGDNYIELDIDVGSSTVARGVVSLVLGYLNNLVIELAFLIQANTEEELPEKLLGTCRINHLDASRSVLVQE